LEQPYHRRDDPTFLDKVDLPLEDRGGVAIETDDKSALHFQASPLYTLDILDQVACKASRALCWPKSTSVR